MTNVNKNSKHKIIVGIIIGVVILVFCCLCIAGGAGLTIYSKNSSTGTIRISSYTESFPGYSDPNEVEVKIRSIFTIKPAVNGKSVFVTDEKGRLEVEVPVGEYELAPMYSPKDKAVKVSVTKDQNVGVYLPIEGAGNYFYKFNCSEKSVFNDKKLRNDIATVINRKRLVSRLPTSSVIEDSYTFILDAFNSSGWADDADLFEEDNDFVTRKPLPLSQRKDFILLANIGYLENDSKTLEILSSNLNKLGVFDEIRINEVGAEEYDDRRKDGKYSVAKISWVYDSNNILDFYYEMFYGERDFDCLDSEIDELIDNGYASLEAGNIDKYEEIVIKINNMIVEDVPAIPLYSYKILDNVLDLDIPEDDKTNNQPY